MDLNPPVGLRDHSYDWAVDVRSSEECCWGKDSTVQHLCLRSALQMLGQIPQPMLSTADLLELLSSTSLHLWRAWPALCNLPLLARAHKHVRCLIPSSGLALGCHLKKRRQKKKKKKSSEGIIPSNMLSGGANVLRLCGPVAGRHSPAATESSLRLDLDLPCPSGLGSKVFGGCAINNEGWERETIPSPVFLF